MKRIVRQKRLKRITLDETAYYHVMSRIAEQRFYLGDVEKEMFCDMMRRVAAFSGVHILTYCIMDNHFHLLIEVPKRREMTFDEVCARLPFIYRGDELQRIKTEIEKWKSQKNQVMLDGLKDCYERRMYDLSEFMKTLKQRFSIWYNRNHDDRKGTLWQEDRFKSVLVESPHRSESDMGNRAILTMAAYIELNSVRAGIVSDPKDYRWCGYGKAIAGNIEAQNGIGFLMGFLSGETVAWKTVSKIYRIHLFLRGRYRNGMDTQHIQKVLDEGGSLSRAELLRCRIRYFTDGVVLGSHAFVNQIRSSKRECFSTMSRSGPIKMHGGKWDGLCAGRELQRSVIMVSECGK